MKAMQEAGKETSMGYSGSNTMRRFAELGLCALLLLGLNAVALADDHKQEKPPVQHNAAPSGGNHQSAPAQTGGARPGQSGPGATRPNNAPANTNTRGGAPAQAGGNQGGRPNGPAMTGPRGGNQNAPNTTGSRGPGNAPMNMPNRGNNQPGNMGRNTPDMMRNRGSAQVVAGPHSAPMPRGAIVARTPGGATVIRRNDGHVAFVRNERTGMVVRRGINGNRVVIAERPDHTRIVVTRPGFGYVQRPYTYRGREFATRVYVRGGVSYNHIYGRYMYRGVYIAPYYPRYYYNPAYYGWLYYPWAVPVTYSPEWRDAGWYFYYGWYFRPSPVYASPAYWLTDYMIAASLQASYAEQQAENSKVVNIPPEEAQQGNAQTPTVLTQETKDMIAEEVKRQIALENAEAAQAQQGAPDDASSSIQRMLTDGIRHVFVAGQYLDLVDATGNECTLTEGDAVQLGQNDPNATDINVIVLASKGGRECAKGTTVSVTLEELQEMQNYMRETIDRGMAELQKKQGTNGLPAAPKDATAAPVESPLAAIAPPPPPADEVKNELTQEQKAADAEEKDAAQATPVSN